MDLEMTGLDPVKDRILEVACIVTDWDFNEIASYAAVKRVGSRLMKKRMVGAFWDEFPEVRDELIAQNLTGMNGRTVENELLAFIDEHFSGEANRALDDIRGSIEELQYYLKKVRDK